MRVFARVSAKRLYAFRTGTGRASEAVTGRPVQSGPSGTPAATAPSPFFASTLSLLSAFSERAKLNSEKGGPHEYPHRQRQHPIRKTGRLHSHNPPDRRRSRKRRASVDQALECRTRRRTHH